MCTVTSNGIVLTISMATVNYSYTEMLHSKTLLGNLAHGAYTPLGQNTW